VLTRCSVAESESTMKPLIGYGSGVSASRRHDLLAKGSRGHKVAKQRSVLSKLLLDNALSGSWTARFPICSRQVISVVSGVRRRISSAAYDAEFRSSLARHDLKTNKDFLREKPRKNAQFCARKGPKNAQFCAEKGAGRGASGCSAKSGADAAGGGWGFWAPKAPAVRTPQNGHSVVFGRAGQRI
jgi:hypothetical protein